MKRLNMPPKPIAGNMDIFRRRKPKHILRVFPFTHDDELHLAAAMQVHFHGEGGPPSRCTGPGCRNCAEAGDNKRLRRQNRFPTLVVDLEADSSKPLRYDMPSSVYTQLYSLLEDVEDPSSMLGNKGTDLTLKYDDTASPANQYLLSWKMGPCQKLAISADALIDLIAAIEAEAQPAVLDDDIPFAGKEPATAAPPADTIRWTDDEGTVFSGRDTGKRRKNTVLVEFEGRIIPVNEDSILKDVAF